MAKRGMSSLRSALRSLRRDAARGKLRLDEEQEDELQSFVEEEEDEPVMAVVNSD